MRTGTVPPRAELGETLSSLLDPLQGLLGSTCIPGILLFLVPPLLPGGNGLAALFLCHFCGVCPFWWAQSLSCFLQGSLEELGQEIQVDFMEHNGQESVSAKVSG